MAQYYIPLIAQCGKRIFIKANKCFGYREH